MMRLRTMRVLFAGALAGLAFSFGMPGASAHVHPPASDLTGPGVVFIKYGYHVQVALIEHNVTTSHINLIKRSYDPVLHTASGFVVDPSADIVTTAAAIAPDEQAAKNYAINSIFNERYPAATYVPNVQIPTNLFTQRTAFDPTVGGPDDYSADNRLRGCYQERTNAAGGCVIYTVPFIAVYPYVTDQSKYGNLDAKVVASTDSGVAVLKVSANSMPAVNLADINASTYHLGVFGFKDIPGKQHPMLVYKAHLDKPGGTRFKDPVGDNLPFKQVTPAVLSSGLQGGPVAAELGQVIGMISATPVPRGQPGAGGPTLVHTDAIRAALKQAGVTPAHGLADGNYETAAHAFQNQGYAVSIPGFRNALAAYPGHFLAAQNLATALAKTSQGQAGPAVVPNSTASPLPAATGTSSSAGSWWGWLLIAAGVLLAAAVIWMLWRRRKRPPPAVPPAGKAAASAPSGPSGPSAPVARTDRKAAHPAGRSSAAAPLPTARPLQPSSVPRRGESTMLSDPAPPRQPTDGMGRSSAVRAPSFCTACGGQLAPHHKFCGWCGDPVG